MTVRNNYYYFCISSRDPLCRHDFYDRKTEDNADMMPLTGDTMKRDITLV